ncbi:MAG TPA: hypothetical protein VIY09_05875 [Rhizomicrobium sp.]
MQRLERIAWIAREGRIRTRRAGRRFAHRLIRSGLATMLARSVALLDRRRGLHLLGWLAGIARRHDDQTDFWNEAIGRFPADQDFARNKIDAALRSGRTAEAAHALDSLIDSGAAVAADCRFVVGLSHVDLRAGDVGRIRRRVRRFLAGLRGRPDYRISAVRLSRLIFAHFPNKRDRAMDANLFRTRFLVMLGRSSVRREPQEMLHRISACETELERQYPGSLFHTDILPGQRRAFVSLVHERLAAGRSFSFIRIGDGEAACLPYEPRLAGHAAADARDRERIWWGEPLSEPVRNRMAPRVARAMWDADCIGIPTTSRFLRELKLLREDTLETSLTGRGLRSILYCSERLSDLRSPGLPLPILTSCHLHQDLALWNGYGELFDGVKEVVLVSCHPELADWVATRFGVQVAANVVLPPDRVTGPLLAIRAASGNLPEMLDAVVDEIGDLPRGRLVLVGAGYPGKLLVSIASRRGGVALDLGSIFDYWLGLNTRSYLDLDPV